MSEKEKVKESKLSAFMSKVTDISKKTATGIQKGVSTLSEQSKQARHDKNVKKYNPLFEEDFYSPKYTVPNVIEIVDDAVRRDIEVCDGAIGWTDKVGEVEILHLYDEYANGDKCPLQFIPFPKCDEVYCIDNFDKTKYLNVEGTFDRTVNEQVAELEHVAYCLGAKNVSIQIEEADANTEASHFKAKAQTSNGIEVGMESSSSSANRSKKGGKSSAKFEGTREPTRPTLKWFAHDNSIKNLIEMRCSGSNSVTYKRLEIKCTASTTMSRKVACAIDAVKKINASASMEKKFVKEHSRVLIWEIYF